MNSNGTAFLPQANLTSYGSIAGPNAFGAISMGGKYKKNKTVKKRKLNKASKRRKLSKKNKKSKKRKLSKKRK